MPSVFQNVKAESLNSYCSFLYRRYSNAVLIVAMKERTAIVCASVHMLWANPQIAFRIWSRVVILRIRLFSPASPRFASSHFGLSGGLVFRIQVVPNQSSYFFTSIGIAYFPPCAILEFYEPTTCRSNCVYNIRYYYRLCQFGPGCWVLCDEQTYNHTKSSVTNGIKTFLASPTDDRITTGFEIRW
jgi:hypothetical protein